MYERFKGYERPEPKVIGSGSPERKRSVSELYRKRFGEGHYEHWSTYAAEWCQRAERPKLPHEVAAIRIANAVSNRLRQRVGLESFDVPERNIHILHIDEPKKSLDLIANTYHREQAVVINDKYFTKGLKAVDGISTIFHEILHLKGFLGVEATESGHGEYRSGLQLLRKAKQPGSDRELALTGLNEAIIVELEKRYLHELLAANEHLEKEAEWLQSDRFTKVRDAIAKEENCPPDEIIWATEDDGNFSRFPFYHQRRLLRFLVEHIAVKSQGEDAKSGDKVFETFVQSYFDGNLLRIARLVEKTFGKDSFELLSRVGKDDKSAQQVLETLSRE